MGQTAKSMDAMPELLGQWYDTVLEPDGVASALKRTQDWLEVDAAYLVGWDKAGVPQLAVFSEAVEDKLVADYLDHYRSIDPRLAHAEATGLREGALMPCSSYMSEAAVSRSEFYQDYLLPSGRRHTLSSRLASSDGADLYLTFYHRKGRATFSAHQMTLARRLVPHVQRAMKLRRWAESLRAAAQASESALDALDHGVVLMDGRGRMLLANSRAHAWLRGTTSMRLRDGRMVATQAGLQDAFAHALTSAIQTGVPVSLKIGATCVTLTRLCMGGSAHQGLGASSVHVQALMIITAPGAQRRVSAQQLIQLFGLTPAEARLAHNLARGDSIEDHVASNGVSVGTVRKQLQAVFGKTGTSRQAELVGLLSMLPSARSAAGQQGVKPRVPGG
jgi:DNA-binding CsgD family transcriptional regulator/PAS domain-containing protein